MLAHPRFVWVVVLVAVVLGRGMAAPNFVWILHAGQNLPEVTCIDAQTLELREPKAGWPVDGFSA